MERVTVGGALGEDIGEIESAEEWLAVTKLSRHIEFCSAVS